MLELGGHATQIFRSYQETSRTRSTPLSQKCQIGKTFKINKISDSSGGSVRNAPTSATNIGKAGLTAYSEAIDITIDIEIQIYSDKYNTSDLWQHATSAPGTRSSPAPSPPPCPPPPPYSGHARAHTLEKKIQT